MCTLTRLSPLSETPVRWYLFLLRTTHLPYFSLSLYDTLLITDCFFLDLFLIFLLILSLFIMKAISQYSLGGGGGSHQDVVYCKLGCSHFNSFYFISLRRMYQWAQYICLQKTFIIQDISLICNEIFSWVYFNKTLPGEKTDNLALLSLLSLTLLPMGGGRLAPLCFKSK